MKDFHVRRGAHWIAISLFLAVTGCGGDSGTGNDDDNGNGGNGGSNPTVTMAVTVGDDFFNPVDIQVSPGALVTWTWSSNTVHNVTFADNSISDSGDQGGGTHETTMPTTTRTYQYQCTIHSGMNGSVLVQ